MFNIIFLYFQSNGCIILSMGMNIQEFKVKLSALPNLPLFMLDKYSLREIMA